MHVELHAFTGRQANCGVSASKMGRAVRWTTPQLFGRHDAVVMTGGVWYISRYQLIDLSFLKSRRVSIIF
jgi:hypothetical protein